ncbi:MAG: RHS repeat-associated core domain-containing protein, partial [Bryobacteraceae bacterium]
SDCGTPTCYFTEDHLGSTRLLTDQNGNVAKRFDYLPFGEEIFAGVGGRTATEGYLSAPDPLNPKFTGKIHDNETGLDFMEARYFSSAQGRFTIPDWSAKEEPVPYAKLENPQSLNLYSYVLNNPISAFDPDGHCDSGGHADLAGPCPPDPAGMHQKPAAQPQAQSKTKGKKFTVTLNKRVANIPGGKALGALGVDHAWISTSEGQSAGMGTAKGGGQIPDAKGESSPDKPGDPTQVVNHQGEAPTSTTTFTNVDKGAINSYLQVGQPTGPWIPEVNDCNTWADNAIASSTPHDTMKVGNSVQHNIVVYADGSIHQPGESQ